MTVVGDGLVLGERQKIVYHTPRRNFFEVVPEEQKHTASVNISARNWYCIATSTP